MFILITNKIQFIPKIENFLPPRKKYLPLRLLSSFTGQYTFLSRKKSNFLQYFSFYNIIPKYFQNTLEGTKYKIKIIKLIKAIN